MVRHGSCSICGGHVSTPDIWWGVVPPTPTCERCGAVEDEAPGPVIKMRPVQTITVSGTGTAPVLITNPDGSWGIK